MTRRLVIAVSMVLALLPVIFLASVYPHGLGSYPKRCADGYLSVSIFKGKPQGWFLKDARLIVQKRTWIRLPARSLKSIYSKPIDVDLYAVRVIQEVFEHSGYITKTCETRVIVPIPTFGLWALVFSAYPLAAFFRGPLRRSRRRRKGCCMKCGYDLTGNVSGVCPECGERI